MLLLLLLLLPRLVLLLPVQLTVGGRRVDGFVGDVHGIGFSWLGSAAIHLHLVLVVRDEERVEPQVEHLLLEHTM